MPADRPIDVGVVGVGSMGKHHARVYDELPEANLIGVFDVDEERANRVAERHGATAMGRATLLESVDAVSIAVPTPHHYDAVTACLDRGVAALVEKPVVGDPETGRELRAAVREANVPVQVGHIERFNPAVRTLGEFVSDLSIVSVSAQRLGPPPERRIDDSAVIDLMIHDIDVVLALFGERPASVQATGVYENRFASALLEFGSGQMASLTASRLTQRKVRTLEITAEECLVELDYLDQTIEIHRDSLPSYVETDGDVRFRHESVVERPHVPREEPLRLELESFLEAVRTGESPEVTVDDGVAALEIARQIEEQGRTEPRDDADARSTEVFHD